MPAPTHPGRAVLAAALTLVLALGAASSAAAAPTWAPAATAAIRPGVQTVSDAGQCTSNFVYADGAGRVYLGQAAHCIGTGTATDTNGCTSGSLPLGTPVQVEGATRPGTLAYSSWLQMQADGTTDPDTCQDNDLALVRLDPADAARTNPSVKFFGGPTAVTPSGTAAGDQVFSYGSSSLRLGLAALSPKRGVSLGTDAGGWNHTVVTVTPGVPGDSGSGFLDAQGRALGVLSTLALAPVPASNGVGDLAHELAYLDAHAPVPVTLARGTEPFSGARLVG